MNKHCSGGCHCGAIKLELIFSVPLAGMHPRACDCDFCYKHGAHYVSDPSGQAKILYAQVGDMVNYGQPGQLTQYLFCRHCGGFVGVSFEADQYHYFAANGRLLNDYHAFGEPVVVAPQVLSVPEKIQRWQSLWFNEFQCHPVTLANS